MLGVIVLLLAVILSELLVIVLERDHPYISHQIHTYLILQVIPVLSGGAASYIFIVHSSFSKVSGSFGYLQVSAIACVGRATSYDFSSP